jgi:glycosyltransferase involved in cell wall biosynthesis
MGFLKTLAFTSTIPGKVRIAPNVTVEQKKEFLRGVSVLCVPGRSHEVAGLYALEAMACGVPVVAAHVGGAGELVNATGGGLLYRAGDTAGMTDTLERLLQNPSLQAELGAKGREAVVRDYSAEAMAIKWLDCLAG